MNKLKQYPPKAAQKLLLLFLRSDLAEEVIGDLAERFDQVSLKKSAFKAKLDYWFQVLHYLRPFAIRRKGIQNLTHYDMFQNYFKIGWRNIIKYKAFSFINVFGLAVAMSVCMLIILMLADQRRYDAFHIGKERIYRILSTTYSTTPYPLAATLKSEYTIAESVTNLTPGPGGDAIYQGKIIEMRGYFADPEFFKVFSFELERGDKSTALSSPNLMVISSELAHQLFNDEDPVGKTIEFANRQLPFPQEFSAHGTPPVSWGSYTISGVIDESKYKSHLKFDVLISSATRQTLIAEKKVEDLSNNWEWFFRTYTYVLLRTDKTPEDLAFTLNDIVTRKYANSKAEQTKDFSLSAQKLSDVQLGLAGNDTNNRLPLIGYYFLAGLAMVIMFSACLNYTNLSIARAITRTKEIGIRKVTGAARKSLVFQFLSESVLTSLIALVMAVIMLIVIARAFKGLWVNQYLNFELPSTPEVYVIFLGFALLIGIVAGVYPAFYLSGYQPIRALKNSGFDKPGKLGLRKVLGVSQFIISLFFITTSILIYSQFKHFITFDYGFQPKNILNVELQGADYQKLVDEFQKVPGVVSISASDLIPAAGSNNNNEVKRSGTKDEYFSIGIITADENFASNIGIKLIAGQQLPSESLSDKSILVNEATCKALGYKFPGEIIGQVLETRWVNEPLLVVGVVKDFRFKLLINEDKIEPLMIRCQTERFEYLNVQLSSTDLRATLLSLEDKWKKIDPAHTFKYEFFDEQLQFTHQAIFDVVSILGFISFLAMVIACLGLLGMAIYSTERRTKEIGIRKVLGAENFSLTILLSKEFLMILVISICMGAPLSYFLNNLWLKHFPNRVEFGPGMILIGVCIMLILGLITIGSQTFKASKVNPVDSLKSE